MRRKRREYPERIKVRDLPLSEFEEAEKLVTYLQELQLRKIVKVYTHVDNETYTPFWSQLQKKKRSGVQRGVPDYMIVTYKNIIFIELKKKKKGVVSDDQAVWIEALQSLPGDSVRAAVCKGYWEAKDFIDASI